MLSWASVINIPSADNEIARKISSTSAPSSEPVNPREMSWHSHRVQTPAGTDPHVSFLHLYLFTCSCSSCDAEGCPRCNTRAAAKSFSSGPAAVCVPSPPCQDGHDSFQTSGSTGNLLCPVLPVSDVSPSKLKLFTGADGSSMYFSPQGDIWQSFKIIQVFGFSCFEVKTSFLVQKMSRY